MNSGEIIKNRIVAGLIDGKLKGTRDIALETKQMPFVSG
jgi:hypothetical protein